MVSEEDWDDMLELAAAGSIEFADLTEENALIAMQRITDHAPDVLQDDFSKCCAYFLYRNMLIVAKKNDDVGQMYNAISSLQAMTD